MDNVCFHSVATYVLGSAIGGWVEDSATCDYSMFRK
jgi:hypothetical protein